MLALVDLETFFLREPLVTHGALPGLLPTVGLEVALHVGLHRELLTTHWTVVWLRATVYGLVIWKVNTES